MSYGIIEYDKDGLPTCKICGEPYKRAYNHLKYAHDLTEVEYRKRFGLDPYRVRTKVKVRSK